MPRSREPEIHSRIFSFFSSRSPHSKLLSLHWIKLSRSPTEESMLWSISLSRNFREFRPTSNWKLMKFQEKNSTELKRFSIIKRKLLSKRKEKSIEERRNLRLLDKRLLLQAILPRFSRMESTRMKTSCSDFLEKRGRIKNIITKEF